MGNQHTNDIYKQYFTPPSTIFGTQPSPPTPPISLTLFINRQHNPPSVPADEPGHSGRAH